MNLNRLPGFVAVLTMLFQSIYAQEYHPMPVSDARWDITRCWSFYPGGWHDEYSVELDGGDTMMNGRIYKKLILVTHHLPGTEHDSVYTNFLGGMRESGRQVFFISEYLCLDTIERMLYDFNDHVTGDTVFTQILTHDLTQFIPHIVTSVDSVWVGDQYHRRIHLKDENDVFSEYWIEGVGSSLGLIYASYWLLTDNSYDLNCFYNEGKLEFTNSEPQYLFCTLPLPMVVCDSTTTSVSPAPGGLMFSIYPNPAAYDLHIESSVNLNEIRIINQCGKQVMKCNGTKTLTLDSFAPGVYFIQVMGNNGSQMAVQKFVKI